MTNRHVMMRLWQMRNFIRLKILASRWRNLLTVHLFNASIQIVSNVDHVLVRCSICSLSPITLPIIICYLVYFRLLVCLQFNRNSVVFKFKIKIIPVHIQVFITSSISYFRQERFKYNWKIKINKIISIIE